MAVVTMRQLLDAGVHFGHQTRRWNPKMRRYILGERNGIYLIDLKKTLSGIEESYVYVRDLVARGGTILFVGTKKQTQGPIQEYADACGMPSKSPASRMMRSSCIRVTRPATVRKLVSMPPSQRWLT